MFDFIRNHRRWMQFILLLLIVPSFMLVGVQGYDSFVNRAPELAEVAGQDVSRAEFDMAHRNQLEQLRQRLGAQFDASLFDTAESRRQLLDDLINQRLLARVAMDNRFSVSDTTLRNTIAAIPQVQDNGRFSPERYRQALAAQGLTPASFEAGLRRDLAVSRVLEPVGSSVRVPETVVSAIEQALTQQRTVQLRPFNAADYRDKVQVGQQDIQAWYDQNARQLEIPEQVQAQYLVLDEAAASQGVQVSDDEAQEYYKQNQSRFGQPERKRLSHILIQVPAGASDDARKQARERAEKLASQAAADPAAFADLAGKNSDDAGSAAQGGDLGWITPPTLAQAVAGLGKDQVSGVIESPAGLHIVKVTDYQAGAAKPLAEVKQQIVDEIRKQKASARFADMATQLTNLVYDQRDSLQPAADALGVPLRTASGITRNGLLPADKAGKDAASAGNDVELLDNPRVREALFSPEVLREKLNSGVLELSSDRMAVVRVLEAKPAHVPPLAEVSDSIRDRLLAQRSAEAARAAGEAELKTLQAAVAPAAAASGTAEAGQTASGSGDAAATAADGFGDAQTVSRQQSQELPAALLETVMRMVPGAGGKPAYAGAVVGQDYVLVRLNGVEAGKTDPEAVKNLSAQLAQAWGSAETDAVVQSLRQQYKVRILPEAESALQPEGASEAG